MSDVQPGPVPPPNPYPAPGARPAGGYGVVGGALAIIGAVLLVLSMTALPWYKNQDFEIKYSDLHDLSKIPGAPGISKVYFGWLGILLAVVVVVLALVANAATSAANELRITGVVIGLAAIAVEVFALKGSGDWSTVFKQSSSGVWLSLGGFGLATLGAALGPRPA